MTVPAHTAPFNLLAALWEDRDEIRSAHSALISSRQMNAHASIAFIFLVASTKNTTYETCFVSHMVSYFSCYSYCCFYFPASPFKDSNSCISDAVSFRLDVIVSPDAFVMLTSRTDPSPIPCLPAACKNFENFGWFAEKISQAFLTWNNFVGFIICSRTPFLPFV